MPQTLIEAAWETRSTLTPANCAPELKAAIEAILAQLSKGTLRVASPSATGWQTHAYIKQAILLSFRIFDNTVFPDTLAPYYDKIGLKYRDYTAEKFKNDATRVVPGAIVREGSYIGKNVVLMPSFVNIGAYIDESTLVDTWATVGSCAQIGKRVHISGGAGIGGVLEPLQASPTIIEDDCFIGARSEIVEGVVIEAGSIISMGVFIGASTKIYDRQTGAIYQGRVPKGSVVVAGSLPSTGNCHLNAAIIVKTVDEKTRAKTSINELLRDVSL